MTRRSFGAARMRFADSILRGFREGGLSDDLTYHAFHVLQSHVLGYTLQESNFELDADELKEMAASFLKEFHADEFPDLAEHIRQHMDPSPGHVGAFAFGLDLILDGLERLRDAT